jgi:GNAT superfamily N-acetyltransferase
MKIDIVEKVPTPDEYNRLRGMVGWGVYEREVAERALPNSLYCVCALTEAMVVGMARVVGDGGLVYYVQDVIVLPDFQRQGIGTAMMNRIMGYVQSHASENSIVGLMAAKGRETFYERYGFVKRPNEKLGCGMTIFWSRTGSNLIIDELTAKHAKAAKVSE